MKDTIAFLYVKEMMNARKNAAVVINPFSPAEVKSAIVACDEGLNMCDYFLKTLNSTNYC